MRLLTILVKTAILAKACVASAKTSDTRFNEYSQISQHAAPLKLSENLYKSIVATPRDYSTAVLLTALESRFNCQLCRDFQSEWEIISRSWVKGDKAGESRILFATLDFVDGRDIFIQHGLQTAPVLLLFPPTTGPHAADSAEPLRFDFTGGPLSAEVVHTWIARQLPGRPHPPISRPINWLRWASIVTTLIGVATFVSAIWPYIWPILQSRSLWASFTMIAVLMFTSGTMFNHIRKVPYVTGDGKGGVQYFVAGFQSQLGLETQIIALIYGVMAFCVISLAVKVPRNADPKSQVLTSLIWSGLLFLVASFLLSIFRIKNGGYPFSLPPFM